MVARSKPAVHDVAWRSMATVGVGRAEAPPRVAEDIADQIQDLIIAEKLSEGARLPSERDLAEMLSISRPTVSQAVRILVVRGLIEPRRGSGAYVTRRPEGSLAASVNLMLSLNEESVGHLNDLRLWLEMTGVRQAIEHISDDVVEAAQNALDEMERNFGDTAAWMSADTLFHATLVRASRNPYLASLYESVHATLINYEYRSWIDKGSVPSWLKASKADALMAVHRPILDAVRAGDYEAAHAAVLHHHDAMSAHLAARG